MDFPRESQPLPMQAELEERFQAKVIVYEDGGKLHAGGMCRCCGSGPNLEPDYQEEPWFIYRTNICDADGVFYAAACQDCLEEMRLENAKRPNTDRDVMAQEIGELMGDDLDGAQTMMDDFEGFEFE